MRNNLLASAVWAVPSAAVVGLGLTWADVPGLVAAGAVAWASVRVGRLAVERSPILSHAAWEHLVRLLTRRRAMPAGLILRRQSQRLSAAYCDADVRVVVTSPAAARPAVPAMRAPAHVPGAYQPALFSSVSDAMRAALPDPSCVNAFNATAERYRRAFEQLDTRSLIEACTSTSAALKQLTTAVDPRVFSDLTGALGR